MDQSSGSRRETSAETLSVPRDDRAEVEVAACAIATARGCRIAALHVAPADFYVPRYGRLFAAALMLDDIGGWDAPVDSHHVRTAAASALTGLPLEEVDAIVRDRSFLVDTKAIFARRVAAGAAKRRAMNALADAYNALGAGEDLGVVTPMLREVQAWMS